MDHFIEQASSSSVPTQHNQMIIYNENFGQSNGPHSLRVAIDEADVGTKNENAMGFEGEKMHQGEELHHLANFSERLVDQAAKELKQSCQVPTKSLSLPEDHDAGSSSSKVIIDAMPLRMVPPLDYKPKRGKGARSPLIDGRRIGLPEGWMFEQRQRTNANYKGKFDQFYYEPGTNKQFRSFKEVEKHLQSKGQKTNPITLTALHENDQKKLETPAVVDLTNDGAGSSNPNPTSSNQQPNKRRKIGAKAKRIKFDFKNQPEEVTWVLADAQTDKWTAFTGQEKVSDDTQQTWAKTLMEINNPKNQDHNNK